MMSSKACHWFDTQRRLASIQAKANRGSRARGGGRCFTRRCSRLVKEQKARLYILRRCATMLVCGYIHGED
ncbi:hypothetical protein EJ110_NYTH30570 [Nymphaea thermarum]|nr:hypothetical protein EJ110_NYTH30570 [Nymphaea thermarum]